MSLSLQNTCMFQALAQVNKVHPVTYHEGSEGEDKYSYILSLISALDGPDPLTFNNDPVPIEQEVGWAPRPVWTGAENIAPQRGPRIIQAVARCCTDLPLHIW